uniref:NHS like 3 n=1 Tax=Oreochromis niloticus TaxID=8128 RepID=A0A669DY86_ORENI
MSRRRSTGDLVPRDITEILAREAKAQRGQRKPGSSLGGAFSWLKGSRRKKNAGNGLNRNGNAVTDAKLGHQNHEHAKAGPKVNEDQKRLTVHYTASQHYQENVFIEGSRPQYLEDLHTEAQEGLKIQQQEEHKNGGNFPDTESIASTDTLHPEDINSKDEDASPESIATAENTDSTVTFAAMTRPALTRQGSTFKPLNPIKRQDKSRKKTRRTTIMGIPNQVQKELALNRNSTFQPLVSAEVSANTQISNSQSSGVVTISTDDGTPVANKLGARVHVSELEAFRDEELVRKHLQDHQDFGSHLFPTSNLRPKSLAVPGMTTSTSLSPSMFNFLQEPQGPVMSISPQATYLSTIIPNAVMPASIEFIEIDRSTSRTRGSSVNHGSSVRTVSKSSLASGDLAVSPLLSRRSDGDTSQTNHYHNDSTLMATSASGSNWSESKSSETIISNSSPLSSKGSRQSSNSSQRVCLNGQTKQTAGDQDLVSFRSSVHAISSPSGKSENLVTRPATESGESGAVAAVEEAKNKKKRSLSVMKTKQPPAPPRRSNSLHSNKIRGNSRVVLVDNKSLNDSASGEVTYPTENIVPEDETKLVSTNSTKIPEDVSNFLRSSSPDSSANPLSSAHASSNEAGVSPESRSSPQKVPPEDGKFERTISPSSGYSSQSGTPTLSPKGISPTSPDKQKKKPVKPERSASRASSSAASPSSSVTSLSSGTSELANTEVSMCSSNQPPQGSSPTVATKDLALKNNTSTFREEVNELLNIPPPPKVKAPCPPPPETWVHNRRTFELLCGPCPNVKQKTAQVQESTSNETGTQTETRKEMQVLDQIQTTTDKPIIELSKTQAKPELLSTMHPDRVHVVQEGKEYPGQEIPLVQDKRKASVDVQQQEQSSSFVMKEPESQGTTPKKDPPPVMKKPMTVLHKGEMVLAEKSVEKENNVTSTTAEVTISVENYTSLENGVTALYDESKTEMDRSEVQSMQTLSIEVPRINKVSPPPTPPPAYHPTPPLSRKTPPSAVSTPPNDLQRVQEEIHIVESSWPPPPPPLEGDSVFDGVDEVDFPPPPPPSIITDSAPDVMAGCVTELGNPNVQTVQSSDLHPTVPQPVINDTEPVIDVQISKSKAFEEISSSVLEAVSPPPVELPLIPSMRRAKSPVPNTAVDPPGSFQKRGSLQIEDPSVSISTQSSALTVPVAPPLPADNLTHGVNFRRHSSLANRDARTKELLSRHKSVPIPKEDANIPLVTPSLLQMVRLRSVNMTEDQVQSPPEDKSTNEEAPVKENSPVSIQGSQNIPQKPIRKSLSLKSPPQAIKSSSVTTTNPSMRLQEAIRMKTAAMSSRDGLPSKLGVKSPTYSCVSEPGALSRKSHEGYDVHKSPASTASFIFSRSTKKVVIETASSPDAQANLKQSLAAELMQVSDQSKAAVFTFDGVKCDKVPPPVAKKPTQSSINSSPSFPNSLSKIEVNVKGNGAVVGGEHRSGINLSETTTTRVTADTIETLF